MAVVQRAVKQIGLYQSGGLENKTSVHMNMYTSHKRLGQLARAETGHVRQLIFCLPYMQVLLCLVLCKGVPIWLGVIYYGRDYGYAC